MASAARNERRIRGCGRATHSCARRDAPLTVMAFRWWFSVLDALIVLP